MMYRETVHLFIFCRPQIKAFTIILSQKLISKAELKQRPTFVIGAEWNIQQQQIHALLLLTTKKVLYMSQVTINGVIVMIKWKMKMGSRTPIF